MGTPSTTAIYSSETVSTGDEVAYFDHVGDSLMRAGVRFEIDLSPSKTSRKIVVASKEAARAAAIVRDAQATFHRHLAAITSVIEPKLPIIDTTRRDQDQPYQL